MIYCCTDTNLCFRQLTQLGGKSNPSLLPLDNFFSKQKNSPPSILVFVWFFPLQGFIFCCSILVCHHNKLIKNKICLQALTLKVFIYISFLRLGNTCKKVIYSPFLFLIGQMGSRDQTSPAFFHLFYSQTVLPGYLKNIHFRVEYAIDLTKHG